MEKKNGKYTLPLMGALLGVVIAGGAGVIRGDWLGREAAEEVKAEVSARIERVEERTDKKFDQILEQLKEIRDRLDDP